MDTKSHSVEKAWRCSAVVEVCGTRSVCREATRAGSAVATRGTDTEGAQWTRCGGARSLHVCYSRHGYAVLRCDGGVRVGREQLATWRAWGRPASTGASTPTWLTRRVGRRSFRWYSISRRTGCGRARCMEWQGAGQVANGGGSSAQSSALLPTRRCRRLQTCNFRLTRRHATIPSETGP